MNSTCKDFLHVHIENKREVKRKAKHYNLDVIISVGKIQKLHNCITAQLHNCITSPCSEPGFFRNVKPLNLSTFTIFTEVSV
jgi:hypothetical protein